MLQPYSFFKCDVRVLPIMLFFQLAVKKEAKGFKTLSFHSLLEYIPNFVHGK